MKNGIVLQRGGQFDLIMADPPWKYQNWSAHGEGKNPSRHYRCMETSKIMALDIGGLGAPSCLLWLWGTHPMVPDALARLEAWGFDFKTSGVWVKKTRTNKLAFGTGYILRGTSEPFFIATKGRPRTTKSIRSVIEGPLREHSRKPDEAFEAAEALMPNARRAELFSRENRPGWTTWGDEAGLFGRSDHRDDR